MTLPQGATLGSTTDPTDLIRGEPGQVSANASAFTKESARISGLAEDVDAIAIPGWAGGQGQPAYQTARSAEQAKWKAYAGLLKTAGSVLSTYATALRTAQSRAQDAITTYQRGQQATSTAVTEFNRTVTAYNAYIDRPVAVSSYGGRQTPTMGPGRPLPFVDPGEPMRTEAEQILKEARETLDTAGEAAVQQLGGLPGALVEGSSGPGASGSVEGPSISFGNWEKTFGKDPMEGKKGTYEGGLKDSPFAINFGQAEGEAHLWGAQGSVQDYWGDVKVHADGKITVGGVDAGAGARIDANGVVAEAHAGLTVVGVEGSAGAEWGYAQGEVTGQGTVGADAEGEVAIGKTGVHAHGEVFAGAKAEGSAQADLGGVGGQADGQVWAGVGASGDAEADYHDGKITIGGSAGLAFGVGGKVSLHVTVDPGKVAHTGEDLYHDALGLFH